MKQSTVLVLVGLLIVFGAINTIRRYCLIQNLSFRIFMFWIEKVGKNSSILLRRLFSCLLGKLVLGFSISTIGKIGIAELKPSGKGKNF